MNSLVCPDCGDFFCEDSPCLCSLMLTEDGKAKPESATTDCSADGSAAPTPTKPGVQPPGPEQTLEKLKAYMERELLDWAYSEGGFLTAQSRSLSRQIQEQYKHMLRMIEGEAGVGQDDRSRPAG